MLLNDNEEDDEHEYRDRRPWRGRIKEKTTPLNSYASLMLSNKKYESIRDLKRNRTELCEDNKWVSSSLLLPFYSDIIPLNETFKMV